MKIASKLLAIGLIVSFAGMSSFAFFQPTGKFRVLSQSLYCKGRVMSNYKIVNRQIVSRVTSLVTSDVSSGPTSANASRTTSSEVSGTTSSVTSRVTSFVALPKGLQYKIRKYCGL